MGKELGCASERGTLKLDTRVFPILLIVRLEFEELAQFNYSQ